jgi:hypothetical protein
MYSGRLQVNHVPTCASTAQRLRTAQRFRRPAGTLDDLADPYRASRYAQVCCPDSASVTNTNTLLTGS